MFRDNDTKLFLNLDPACDPKKNTQYIVCSI